MPPLLLLHGFLGRGADWRAVTRYLSCPALTPDLTLTPPPLPEACHLAGYSMGGRIAMQLALAQPERILSLALISAHPGLTSGHAERAAQDEAWAVRFETENFDAVLRDWYNQPLFATLRGKDALIRAVGKAHTESAMAAMLRRYSLAQQPCYLEPLARAPFPVTWIYGTQDLPYRRLYAAIEGRVIGLEGGHALHREQPERIAHELDAARQLC